MTPGHSTWNELRCCIVRNAGNGWARATGSLACSRCVWVRLKASRQRAKRRTGGGRGGREGTQKESDHGDGGRPNPT